MERRQVLTGRRKLPR